MTVAEMMVHVKAAEALGAYWADDPTIGAYITCVGQPRIERPADAVAAALYDGPIFDDETIESLRGKGLLDG